MSRFICWLLLGHLRRIAGRQLVQLTSETFRGPTTDVLYRCERCQRVWSENIPGDWSAEQVMPS